MREGWEIKTLGEVANIVNGGTPKSKVSEYWGGDVNWLTPKDMGKMAGRYIDSTPRKITAQGLEKSSAKLANPMSVIMSTRAPIGHLAINQVPMAFNQGCRGLEPSSDLDVHFLYYYLDANVAALNELGTGATFRELSAKALKTFPIPLPPLAEQKRIVGVLDQAFAGIEQALAAARKNRANARELFETTLNTTFTQKGEGWVVRKLGDESLVKIIDGDRGTNYPKKVDFLDEGFCLFLNTKNVRPDGFNFDVTMFISAEKDQALRKGKLERRDVLLTTRGTIGNIALFDSSVPFDNIRINSGMLIFRPNEKEILADYLFELFRSSFFKSQVSAFVSGAAQPQLPIKTLIKFDLPVPKSLKMQKEIVEMLRAVWRQTQALEALYQQKIDTLNELKQSLLQQAFAGELTTTQEDAA